MTTHPNFNKYSAGGTDVQQDGNLVTFRVSGDDLREVCRKLYFDEKLQLLTIAASDERAAGVGFRILYLFGAPGENIFVMPYVVLEKEAEFPSLTLLIHEASGYERKIRTLFGLEPVGHPHPRAMLLHENWPEKVHPLRKDFVWTNRPPEAKGEYPMEQVEGEGVYEIPVGPVHAGIIEPGHFRFSIAGEEIVLLEAKLGYKHKGIEKLFETLALGDKIRLAERVSGDSSFTHALAFCQALETLGGVAVPERAKYLRVIFSELERLANHLNDVGFVLLDTGFSFGGANGARLRETVMQWNEKLSGSRFLRGVVALGGVNKDIPANLHVELLQYLESLRRDFEEIIAITEGSISVFNRLEGTGKLDPEIALDHGVIGIAGRAVGIDRDARTDYPYAAYGRIKFDATGANDGDVLARFSIRVGEVRSSIKILEQAIKDLPPGSAIKAATPATFKKNAAAVGVAEAWRGTVVYLVLTDLDGNISRVEVRDPSFLNWAVVGHSGKGNVVPDFPLINKSFNLSYSGNDL